MSQMIIENITEQPTAYHLTLQIRELEARNKGDEAIAKKARTEFEKDEAEISDSARSACSTPSGSCKQGQNETMNHSEFTNKVDRENASTNWSKDLTLSEPVFKPEADSVSSQLEQSDPVTSKPVGTINLEYYHEITQHMAVLRIDQGA